MQNIDLVISIDSSLVHLSSTLGIKTFALLHFCPDWRWKYNYHYPPLIKDICKYIPNNVIENDTEATGEYNVDRYLDAFNKRVKPLLVCFDTSVRDDILVTTPLDRKYFTRQELELTSGKPYNDTDQDKIEGI